MPDFITYGSYSLPTPLPAIAESDDLIKIAGKYDHRSTTVNLIGFLTGENLSGIHRAKMEVISGFLSGYQDLTVQVGDEQKVFDKCFVKSIQFQEGDLTTILPYTVDLLSYKEENFSNYFGISDPTDNWSYAEQDNKIIQATHTVSAMGLKVNNNDPFDNARNFVSGRLQNFEYLGVFNAPESNIFLNSRTESIDRKSNKYSVTEVYNFSASEDIISNSGIVTFSTNITYDKNQQLVVTLNGSIQGSIDACITGGLLTTGNFTPAQATNLALNSVINSSSSFESGVYAFLSNGPTAFEYSLNTGSNKLDFSFKFENPEDFDLIDGVLHIYDTSISCSKDQAVSSVSVQGTLRYNLSDLNIASTGQAGSDNPIFQKVESAFQQVDQLSLAKFALQNFAEGATGYEIVSTYLNSEPLSFSIQKNPITNEITYDYTYNNNIDYSSGSLKDFVATIIDSKPLQLVSVQESIGGYVDTVVANRTLGQYSVSASASNQESDLPTLKQVVSGLCSGSYELSSSQNINIANISFNLAKYY